MNIHCIRKDNLQQLRKRQEVAHHKTWSITLNRDRTKKDLQLEKTSGLLYIKRDNIYIDLNKKDNKALKHQEER